jgi:transcriptional antiterminator RfaH
MREGAAAHFLQLAKYQVYLPRLRVVRAHRGRKIETKPPLFPSYLFLMVTAGWWDARWCPHVIRLITNGHLEPARVADQIIDDLRKRERNGLIELPKRSGLKPGDRVKVLQGPFADHFGLYVGQRPHERVLVLLALLGGQQRVELAKADIEAVQI